MPLVLDLRITRERWGSSPDPNLNGNLHYPNDTDRSLNESSVDKIRKYRADYNNRPPNAISFMFAIASTSGRLHSEFVRLLFLQEYFHFRRSVFLAQMKFRVGLTLAKAEALRTNLNIDGDRIGSKSHIHPSHSQTSRLLTSSQGSSALIFSLSSHRHSYLGLVC